jgi:hypothetical protein
MAASIRESLVRAVLAAIDGAEKPGGLRVHRWRKRPLEKDRLPAVCVYLLQEQLPEEKQLPARTRTPVRRKCTIVCECRVVGDATANTSPDEALDPIVAWVVQAVLADPTLGNLAHAVTEIGTKWDADELNETFGAAAIHFEIDYLTAAGDPARKT